MLAKLIKGDIDKNKLAKKEGGFTIVEVMIVLAIAGLVLAIVFIAVPALQRNARNTQRRADLSNLRAQIDTWTSNNNGKLPSDSATSDMESIIGSTGWGHYNGNSDEPALSVIDGTTVVAAAASTTAPTRLVGPANITAASGEYTIIYGRDATDTNLATFTLPNRQEIHVWGEVACSLDILTNGNDVDDGGTALYVAADLEQSNARALAYVYQVEGEDRARCEDNV